MNLDKLRRLAENLTKDELVEILLKTVALDDASFIELRLIFEELEPHNRARIIQAARDLYQAQS